VANTHHHENRDALDAYRAALEGFARAYGDEAEEPDADIVLADGERFNENNLFPGETPNEVRE
jgi:hypothetical protein